MSSTIFIQPLVPCIGIKGHSTADLLRLIVPTPAYDEKLTKAWLQIQQHFSPLGNVVNVGSFGKKTHIVKTPAPDLDVVVLFAAPFSAVEHKAKVRLLEEQARKQTSFTDIKITQYSVQFRVCSGDLTVDVDLLPAIALEDPVRFLVKWHGEACFQACASYGQTKFIRAQPVKYRQLVRLVKWWKHQHKWPTNNTAPISYLIEIVVLHVFNSFAAEDTPLEDLFQRVMEKFTQTEEESIIFNVFYHTERVLQQKVSEERGL